MKWFRRSLDDFEGFDRDENGQPLFPHAIPEPWRDTIVPTYLLPITFIDLFIDHSRVHNIERTEHDYVSQLAEAIDMEGLKVPPSMRYDHAGLVRYHDGYHRYAAIKSLGYFHSIPVTLKESPRVRGHGRLVSEEVIGLFEACSNNHTRSSDKVIYKTRTR